MRLPLAFLAATLLAQPAVAGEVTAFAAASLKNALDTIAADWQAETGNSAVIAYDGSAKLARQIQQGAPADVFISAAEDWMDVLQDEGLIRPETRRDLLGNRLVLIAHGTVPAVPIGAGLDLKGMLGGGKLAMGQVDSVPAGQYGKAALEKLGARRDQPGAVAAASLSDWSRPLRRSGRICGRAAAAQNAAGRNGRTSAPSSRS